MTPLRDIKRHLAPCLSLVAAMLLTACGLEGTNFSQYHNVDANGWRYGDTLAYCVRVADTSGYGEAPDTIDTGELRVALRHDGTYPYSAVAIEVTYPERGRLRRDTVKMQLADGFGRWTGKGFGDSYQTEAVVSPRLTVKDSTMVTIRHVVRVDTLRGISQVGVFFERTAPARR